MNDQTDMNSSSGDPVTARVEIESFRDGRWEFHAWLWGDDLIGSGQATSLMEAATAARMLIDGVVNHG